MKPDPIVEEARCAGQAFLNSFGGDLRKAAEELNRRTQEAGRAVMPPVPARPSQLDGSGIRKVS